MVRGDQSLREAFDSAASGHERLVAVTDAEGRVVSALLDSDIRRAVLRGSSLEEPVASILSSAPLLLASDEDDARVRSQLIALGVPAAPVVDAERRLVGVRRLVELAPEHAVPPVGVLMVGGRGERLRPLTDKLPKPLLRVGGAAVVERLIDAFRLAGVRDIYLTLNYLAEQFEERLGDGSARDVRLHYVRETQPLNTAGALSLLPPQDRLLLVSNGDLVTTVDFAAMVDYHRVHQAAVTVAGVEYAATVPYGVLARADHHLLHIDEKPTTRQLVNGGMYVLSPEVLRYVPAGKPMLMTDLIDAVLQDGLGVVVFPVLERWSDIGSRDELDRVLIEFAVDEEG